MKRLKECTPTTKTWQADIYFLSLVAETAMSRTILSSAVDIWLLSFVCQVGAARPTLLKCRYDEVCKVPINSNNNDISSQKGAIRTE